MTFPPEFSREAQAAVEGEKILANDEFDMARGKVEPGYYGGSASIAMFIRTYVVRTVLAFAKEACKLGREGTWGAAAVDSQVHDFMLQVCRESEREKRFYRNGAYIEKFSLINVLDNYRISLSELHLLKALPDWKEYQKLLLEVTRAQRRRSLSGTVGSGKKLKSYREEAKLTQEILAGRVGLTPRSVKRHEASKTQIRSINRTAYEKELTKILGRPIVL